VTQVTRRIGGTDKSGREGRDRMAMAIRLKSVFCVYVKGRQGNRRGRSLRSGPRQVGYERKGPSLTRCRLPAPVQLLLTLNQGTKLINALCALCCLP